MVSKSKNKPKTAFFYPDAVFIEVISIVILQIDLIVLILLLIERGSMLTVLFALNMENAGGKGKLLIV